jgi:hypothetical protein
VTAQGYIFYTQYMSQYRAAERPIAQINSQCKLATLRHKNRKI